MPAENSSIPLLISKRNLFWANTLFSFTLYGSFMIGYTLAGPVFNLFGVDAIFYSGAICLSAAFFISHGLPKLETKNGHTLSSGILNLILTETKSTYFFVKGKLSIVCAIVSLSGIQGMIGVLAVTIASYMERVLRIQATDASVFLMLG